MDGTAANSKRPGSVSVLASELLLKQPLSRGRKLGLPLTLTHFLKAVSALGLWFLMVHHSVRQCCQKPR